MTNHVMSAHEATLADAGVPLEMIGKAVDAGIKIVVLDFSVKFSYQGVVVEKFKAAGDMLDKQQLKKDSAEITKVLAKALNTVLDIASDYDPASKATVATITSKNPANLGPATLLKKSAAKADVSKLSQATEVGQAIMGTSSGSKYMVIAIGERFNVAARLKSSTLAIRIEPRPGHEGEVGDLKKAGCMGPGYASVYPGYASLHCTVPTDELAKMTVGAVLASLPDVWATGLPDLSLYKGA
jgi:hypothetical protein